MRARGDRFEWKSAFPSMGIVAGLLGISLLSFASYSSIGEFQAHSDWVEHTHLVRFELEQTYSMIRGAQTSVRGFVIAGKPEFLVAYDTARHRLPAKITALSALVADNPIQVKNIALLKTDIETSLGLMAQAVALRSNSVTPQAAMDWVNQGYGTVAIARIGALVLEMQGHEAKLLQIRQQQATQSAHQTKSLIVYGTLAAYLLFGGAFWMLVHQVRRRQRADDALVQANRDLLQRAGQLEATNKELESFSYSISHDLRIPLRAISGYAGMLAEDYEEKLDNEGQRLLSVIRDNSKRMGDLIDDLLAFSRLGRKALSSAHIDMQGLVQNVVADMQVRDQARHANVILEELPSSWGDRALLEQVWVNLISNALKYSSKTDVAEVRISGTRDGHKTVYAVRDNGVGFDMQYYDKLFGVFQRLHRAEEFPGTGVGLAIVQRIVVRHGGHVWAESTLNKGATFFFELPEKG